MQKTCTAYTIEIRAVVSRGQTVLMCVYADVAIKIEKKDILPAVTRPTARIFARANTWFLRAGDYPGFCVTPHRWGARSWQAGDPVFTATHLRPWFQRSKNGSAEIQTRKPPAPESGSLPLHHHPRQSVVHIREVD
jgi:hypothetical protein